MRPITLRTLFTIELFYYISIYIFKYNIFKYTAKKIAPVIAGVNLDIISLLQTCYPTSNTSLRGPAQEK